MLKEIVNRRVICVAPDSKVAEAARIMTEENVGSVLVCNDRQPRGILTDRDIVVRCIAKNVDVNDCTVDQILSEPVELVKETDGIYDCIRKMKEQGVRRMPVVNDRGEAVGVISFDDLIVVLSKEFSELVEAAAPIGPAAKASQLRAA